MLSQLALICLAGTVLGQFIVQHPPAVHYTLERRGGAFAPNWTADLDYLLDQLRIAESRFNFTRREVKGNKIVRVPKDKAVGGGELGKMIGEFGLNGSWYATIKLGTPPQKVNLDIDMLTKDFAVTTTSSNSGSRYNDVDSKTFTKNALNLYPFPNCEFPQDVMRLPLTKKEVKVSFTHCKPRRQSLDTLRPSGSIIGLAPSTSLSQLDERFPSLIKQLKESGEIREEVISLTLISGEQGILSVGGTIQEQVEKIEMNIEGFLSRPGHDSQGPVHGQDQNQNQNQNQDKSQGQDQAGAQAAPLQKREDLAQRVPNLDDFFSTNRFGRQKPSQPHIPSWRDSWKWTPVEGAAGWWQILMRGIWADSIKVMKNQPCIIDINTPFILAPPLAAKAFYSSVSGSYRLPPPYSNFYAYPCNNPPYLHFEFDNWRFPVMRGTKSATESRGANGKFSLGKVREDTGYCVGAVVETRMGVGDAAPLKRSNTPRDIGIGPSFESGLLAGNGLRDVWVLGEPMFRGMGLIFDMNAKQVGFRTY